MKTTAAKRTFAVMLALFLAWPAMAEPIEGIVNYYVYSDSLATGGEVDVKALAELKAQGFTQIIDLRNADEGVEAEQAAAQAAGLAWHHLPTGGELVDSARLQAFGEQLKNGKTLVHCRSGNRVGMTWALYQLSQGVALEQALAEARAMGMKDGFEQAIRAQVGQ